MFYYTYARATCPKNYTHIMIEGSDSGFCFGCAEEAEQMKASRILDEERGLFYPDKYYQPKPLLAPSVVKVTTPMGNVVNLPLPADELL